MYRAIILFFLLPLTGFGQDFKVEFEEYELDNGLHVILHVDRSAPVVATSIMYDVGSKHEDPNATGTAHYLEHLMFEGSKNIDRGEFSNYVQAAGGELNANTSFDRTYYFETLPSNQLELGLWLESERLMHAVAANSEEGLETQRDVVIEERKQRIDNRPYGDAREVIKNKLFQDHAYQHPLIGYMDHLENLEASDLNAIYDTYYVPNNAVLVVAGDIDIDSTKRMVEKYYGSIPRGEDPPELDFDEPKRLNGEVRDTVYDEVQLPGVVHGFKTPGMGSEDYHAMDMLTRVLARGESSRMHRRLVEDEELAMASFTFPFPMYDEVGISMSFALANSGVGLGELEKAMDDEYRKIREEGITEKELKKARNQIESELIEQNSSIGRKAMNLASYHLLRGDTDLINQEIQNYQEVTVEDIKRVADEYLRPSNRVTLHYLPKSEKK